MLLVAQVCLLASVALSADEGLSPQDPFRSLAPPHVTRIAPCGVFVSFRDAERFVFRARTDPKDATLCRRCGEGRGHASAIETPAMNQ